MSFLLVEPDLVTAAAANLAGIRSALSEAAAAASTPTTALASAGADEVSAAVSRLFGAYGQQFQALNARAATFHAEFVSLLNGGAAAYTGAEAASVSSMQALLDAVNAPTAASVVSTHSMVANDGASMPAPLAMPPTVQLS